MIVLLLIIFFLLNQELDLPASALSFFQNFFSPLILPIEAFGILGIFWIIVVIIITISPLFVALLWVPLIYDAVFDLAIYHKIFEDQVSEFQICRVGEHYNRKILRVAVANIVIIFSLIFALVYIYNSFHSVLMTPICVNQTVSCPKPLENGSDPVFMPTLLSIPLLLLSLRLLANPTRNWISDSPRLPGLLSSLNFGVYSKDSTPNSITITKIRHFKDQVCGLYFSFILGTLLLFYFSIIYSVYSVPSYAISDLVRIIWPKMDPFAVIFFVITEVIIIFITTLFGEWYLRKFKPIDQV